jgi:hypothetical protein
VLNQSGPAAIRYAVASGISANSLRRWRDLFDAEEVTIDWRSRVRPCARSDVSGGVGDGQGDCDDA